MNRRDALYTIGGVSLGLSAIAAGGLANALEKSNQNNLAVNSNSGISEEKDMKPWIRDRNCFAARFKLDPTKHKEFIQALDDLGDHAEPYYRRGCAFAFQGYARDPNEFVVFASWDEDVVRELRATDEFQRCNQRMMDCCVEPVIMEQFSGAEKDRSVFDQYPAGSSGVHKPGEKQKFIFL